MKIETPSGKGWKPLLTFELENIAVVRAAARSMVKCCSAGRIEFRIVDDEGMPVSRIDNATCEWKAVQ